MKNSKGRGRPRREWADALRAQVWVLAVEKASGLKADALEAKFRALPDEKSTSGLWNKYGRGDSTPKPALIDKVEFVYPGTAWWFYHPLWRLLRTEPVTFAELKELFFCLNAETKALLVFEDRRQQFFWRTQEDIADTGAQLLQLEQGMDVLCAFILLVQEAEFRQDPNQFRTLLLVWADICHRVQAEWPFCEKADNQNSIFLVITVILSDRWTPIVEANHEILMGSEEESTSEAH